MAPRTSTNWASTCNKSKDVQINSNKDRLLCVVLVSLFLCEMRCILVLRVWSRQCTSYFLNYRSSYIATTITMMAWSIMFHSWVTFVFLMWANVVWLCHDQRSFMLKTSPVLVIYAMLLLSAQYIYGMDLTTGELPSQVTVSGHIGIMESHIYRYGYFE